jgi:oligosaccharide repeat unit polymerase
MSGFAKYAPVVPIGIGLGLAIPLLVQAVDSRIFSWVCIVALFVVGLLPLAKEWSVGKFDFFHLKNLFIFYYLVQFAVYPAYALIIGQTTIPWMDFRAAATRHSYSMVTLWALIGLIVFQLGTRLAIGRKLASVIPNCRELGVYRLWLCWVFIGIGAFALVALFERQGGFEEFFFNLGRWRAVDLIGQGYLLYPATGMISTAALILFVRAIREGRGLTLPSVFYGFCLLPTLLTGFRVGVAIAVLQWLATWHYTCRRFTLRVLSILAVSAYAFLAIYGAVRVNVEGGGLSSAALQLNGDASTTWLAVLNRSSGTDIVGIVFDRIEETRNYRYFWPSFVEAATILVPRSIWQDKPTPLGIQFGGEFMFDYLMWRDKAVGEAVGGFSPTAVGFFYWQGGYVGIIFGMLILGIIAAAIYEYLSIAGANYAHLLIYVTLMSVFPIFAEAPQEALNNSVIRLTFLLLTLLPLTSIRLTSAASS